MTKTARNPLATVGRAALLTAALALTAPIAAPVTTARADGGDAALGAIGGLVLGRIISNQERQTRAMEQQQRAAPPPQYYPPPPQYAPPPPAAAPQQGTVEQRMAQLNSLRQQGLISEAEYQAKRQAIIDSL